MGKKKTNEKIGNMFGKAWILAGKFDTFDEADAKRNKILKNEGTQAKVRRRDADSCFTVHYRNLQKVQEKNNTKKKKRNK